MMRDAGITVGRRLPWADGALARDVQRMRRVGHHGGAISPHRALLVSPVPARRWVPAALMALGFCVVWLLLLAGPAACAWAGLLEFWRGVLGLGGPVTLVEYDFYGLYRFAIPFVPFGSALPGHTTWWWGAIFMLALFAGSFALPRRWLPARTALRVLAFFQLTAQVYFAFWPESFPYTGDGYVHGMLIAGAMMIAIVPLLLGATWFVLDFDRRRQAALTALLMAHLFVLVPLQYLAHGWIVHRCSLLFLPFVFLAGGLWIDVMAFVGYYAWGASWRSLLRQDDAWWEERRLGRNGNGNGNGNGYHNGNGNGHARPAAGPPPAAPRADAATALLAFALLAAAAAPARAQEAEPPAARPFSESSVQAGAMHVETTEGIPDADAQFVRLRLTRPGVRAWNFEIAHVTRFDDESFEFAAGWMRNLGGGTELRLGGSTGTGDFIASRWRADASLTFPVEGFLVAPGYTRIQSKGENSSDGFGLAVTRWFGRWVAGVDGRYELGHPGDTESTSFGCGLSYLVWRRTHLGAGARFGEASYLLVGPDRILVDYYARSFHAGVQQWLGERTGFDLRLDYGETPFWIERGATLTLFLEW